mgnify:CR=1 FL=1
MNAVHDVAFMAVLNVPAPHGEQLRSVVAVPAATWNVPGWQTVHGTHIPLRGNWPAAHVRPQVEPLHVAVPFAEGHARHEVPHELTAVLGTHCWPQACSPVGHRHVPAEQEPPAGQSVLSLQPARHCRDCGSQK